ncbi:MAG: hypothetical protein QOD00_3618 [Blastocatellia bacterium]|jgi:hypothetical protein|nr:hypothetical protein [Blastocatellia bacterium]
MLLLMLAASLFCGCARTAKEEPDTAQGATTPRPSPKTPFEQDVQYVRDGQFAYIFVFSRKDGGVFDKDDVDYLKANSPSQTNQWIKTEEGRRVIAGTNFEFTPENLDALRKRFNVEDYGSGKQ